MDKHFVALKFQELRYLHTYVTYCAKSTEFIHRSFTRCDDLCHFCAEFDTYVDTAANASNLILYPRLFEELKTIL